MGKTNFSGKKRSEFSKVEKLVKSLRFSTIWLLTTLISREKIFNSQS